MLFIPCTLSSATEEVLHSDQEVLIDEAREGTFITNNGAYFLTLNTTVAASHIALIAFGPLAVLYLSAKFNDETGYGSDSGGYGDGHSGGYGHSGFGSSGHNHRSKRDLNGGV